MAVLRYLLKVLIVPALIVALLCAFCWYNINYSPLNIPSTGYTVVVPPGTSLKKFTNQLFKDKIIGNPKVVRWYGVYKGYDRTIKAGEYVFASGLTAAELLNQMVQGKVVQHSFTIIEGWRFKNVLDALHANPKIVNTLKGLDEAQIIAKLQIPVTHLEGVFLPDTYYFTIGTSDVALLRRAYKTMQLKLQVAWEHRAADINLHNPYEALILASIIEKESGLYDEYAEISGVFHRRMALGMRLQADPCVIYGLASDFTGALSKANLLQDSPYNTYTRNGLPPTPIALPSMRAVNAALHPAPGESLYFVASGDGRHIFSKDLVSHNTAVKSSKEQP